MSRLAGSALGGILAAFGGIAGGMIVVGLPVALMLAGLITLFQRSSEDAYRGRVFGAESALEGVTVLAGTLGDDTAPDRDVSLTEERLIAARSQD